VRRMKIAFMGIRGIPASYSGFETFVEQLSKRLVRRGHDVTVYNRSTFVLYRGGNYLGVRLVRLPTLATKHLDSIVHTFLCCVHAFFVGYDLVYVCGVGNAPLAFLLRLRKTKVILNVDGADWMREKWGGFARHYLRTCERIATRSAHVVIADSRVIERRYEEKFGIKTLFIPYGANIRHHEGSDVLERFGLESRRYILFVGRLVPENCAHTLINAFSRVETDLNLVIVGDAPYADEYKASLKASAGLTRNTPANMEVVGRAAATFDHHNDEEDLALKLQFLVDHPEEVLALRMAAEERVREKYSWEKVTDRYELLYRELSEGRNVREIADQLEELIPLEPVPVMREVPAEMRTEAEVVRNG